MLGKLVLAALLAVSLASAQRGGGGGRNSGGMEGMSDGPPIRTQRLSKLQQFSEKLKLNKEQIEQVNAILRAALEQAGPLSTQLENGRTQIAGALIDGSNPDALAKQLDAYTAVEVQLDTMEAETFAKIFALLKPNQQPKAGQAFELMTGIFDRAAMQAGAGGRRGR